jgi:hypothetical protein
MRIRLRHVQRLTRASRRHEVFAKVRRASIVRANGEQSLRCGLPFHEHAKERHEVGLDLAHGACRSRRRHPTTLGVHSTSFTPMAKMTVAAKVASLVPEGATSSPRDGKVSSRTAGNRPTIERLACRRSTITLPA